MKQLPDLRLIFVSSFFVVGFIVGLTLTTRVHLSTPLLPRMLVWRARACESLPNEYVFVGSKKHLCYISAFVGVVEQFGMQVAVSTMQTYIATPGGKFLEGQRCHSLAHEIGDSAVRAGTNPHTLLTQCQKMCLSFDQNGVQSFGQLDLGCMNGAAHTWVLLSSDISRVAHLCNDPRVPEATREGCFHGIGHGLSEKYGGSVIQEVDECKKLPPGKAQYECAHAVFMETQILHIAQGLPTEILAFCRGLSGDMQPACFRFAGFMSYVQRGNVMQALALCNQAPNQLQELCRSSVGVSIYLVHNNRQDVLSCLVPDRTVRHDCIAGFVEANIDNTNDLYGDHAFAVCDMLHSDDRPWCFRFAGQVLGDRYGQETRMSSCASLLQQENKKACLSNEPL